MHYPSNVMPVNERWPRGEPLAPATTTTTTKTTPGHPGWPDNGTTGEIFAYTHRVEVALNFSRAILLCNFVLFSRTRVTVSHARETKIERRRQRILIDSGTLNLEIWQPGRRAFKDLRESPLRNLLKRFFRTNCQKLLWRGGERKDRSKTIA